MNCRECNKELSGHKNKIYCSNNCKSRYRYKNMITKEKREKIIENNRKRVEELRLDIKTKKKQLIIENIVSLHRNTEDFDLVMELYKKIY